MKKLIKVTMLIITIALTFTFIGCNGDVDQTFTVTFDADNGSPNTIQTVTEGKKITKQDNPTKEDYSFGYWFNIVDNLEWDFNTAVTSDISLKAKWALAETAFRKFNDQFMFSDNDGPPNYPVDYFADIIDARTGTRYETLQHLGIVEQFQNAISVSFTVGANIIKNRFRAVFDPISNNLNGKVTITIENNVNYESYEVDNSANVRFNIAYLLTVSDDDLQTAITNAVMEMRSKF